MTTFIEKLEATKTHEHRGIRWTPCDGTGCACSGKLTITQGKTGRDCQTYTVTEFPVGRGFSSGRAAWLAKEDGSEVYAVFVADAGRHSDHCDCKGFSYKGHCKHVDAFRAIAIENPWLADPRTNAEADHGATEIAEQAERFETLPSGYVRQKGYETAEQTEF